MNGPAATEELIRARIGNPVSLAGITEPGPTDCTVMPVVVTVPMSSESALATSRASVRTPFAVTVTGPEVSVVKERMLPDVVPYELLAVAR